MVDTLPLITAPSIVLGTLVDVRLAVRTTKPSLTCACVAFRALRASSSVLAWVRSALIDLSVVLKATLHLADFR